MKVAIINRSDRRGGAAVVSLRLTEALRRRGIDARLLTCEKISDAECVSTVACQNYQKIPFLAERLGVFVSNGFDRRSLFALDPASHGLPLWKDPFVREADVLCLNWINQGMLSLDGLKKLIELRKPIVWTMHDMWNLTGICHHSGLCERYCGECGECGECPLLGRKSAPDDLSRKVWKRKKEAYDLADSLIGGITFVAVSNWLADRAKRSGLLKDRKVEVIPNPFPVDTPFHPSETNEPYRRKRVIFGAARLDDPVKGLPILKRALEILCRDYPGVADTTEIITFGTFKNPESATGFALPHTHLGVLSSSGDIVAAYRDSHVVVSSSLWETLPGTLVEGQANGCIPVSFDRGGQLDIIDHGKTGYIAHFEEGDDEGNARRLAEALAEALTSAPATICGDMLRSVVERFDSDAIARRYEALFTRSQL